MQITKNKLIGVLFILIALFIFSYSWLDGGLENFLNEGEVETTFIERVIDGDTVVSNGTSIRLLGINTPERGEEYYEEAKIFLEGLVLNKTVGLLYGKDKTDRYGRTLAYIIYRGENINLKLVEEGFANYYFPAGKDKHYNEFKAGWMKCVEKEINLCKPSKNICSECIELKEFDHWNQEVVFKNICSVDCDLEGWNIKDEGRKNFIFDSFVLEGEKEVKVLVGEGEDSSETLYWKGETYVWTSSGDTLFLRDGEGRLVLWEGY